MAELWEKLMSGETLSQAEIGELYNAALGKIRGANAMMTLAQSQIKILQQMCPHPRMPRSGRCPDCGLDNSPDGY